MDRAALVNLIVTCVRDFRVTLPNAGDVPVEPTTRLFGPSGLLDSLGLVSVIVDIEQRLADEHGLTVSLMDDRAMSQSRSPFRTPETLADYIQGLVAEQKNG